AKSAEAEKPEAKEVPKGKAHGKAEAAEEQETAKEAGAAGPESVGRRNGLPKPRGKVVSQKPQPDAEAEAAPEGRPDNAANLPAGPATRRIARELGIDLTSVHGSGPGGRIYQSDVIDYFKQLGASAGGGIAA